MALARFDCARIGRTACHDIMPGCTTVKGGNICVWLYARKGENEVLNVREILVGKMRRKFLFFCAQGFERKRADKYWQLLESWLSTMIIG